LAYFTAAPHGARCVFSTCGHAEADTIYNHEFANYSPKPLCLEHAAKVNRLMTKKGN